MTVATNYNSDAMEKMITETKKAMDASKKAVESAENSDKYIKSHPEAGGNLASENGGSVASYISSVLKKALDKFQWLSKAYDKLLKVKKIYDAAVKVIAAFQEGGLSAAIGELGNIVADRYGVSELLDAVANGDANDLLEASFGTAGDIIAETPANAYFDFRNARGMTHGLGYADEELRRVGKNSFDEYYKGNASLTEASLSSAGAFIAGAGIGFTDVAANALGIDISDRWSTAIVEGGAAVGKYVGGAVDWVLNGMKSLFRR